MHMKVISCTEAVEMIPDGSSVMIGGFTGAGAPHRIIAEMVRQGRKNLTVISNDAGGPDRGVGRLVAAKLIRKLIASHIGLNPQAQQQVISGEMEAELCPQGTLAERIRAGGFGLGGVLTPTGLGTVVADGKEIIEVDGKPYLLEKPLTADFALVAAHLSDYRGNLKYLLTSRNFNIAMAMSGRTVIAEPEHIVPIGVIPPDSVATPFVCVDYIIERCEPNGR
jgi:acetate CoA/acetoacetate CoA-transferase alpha subunit